MAGGPPSYMCIAARRPSSVIWYRSPLFARIRLGAGARRRYGCTRPSRSLDEKTARFFQQGSRKGRLTEALCANLVRAFPSNRRLLFFRQAPLHIAMPAPKAAPPAALRQSRSRCLPPARDWERHLEPEAAIYVRRKRSFLTSIGSGGYRMFTLRRPGARSVVRMSLQAAGPNAWQGAAAVLTQVRSPHFRHLRIRNESRDWSP